jgi:hypothetical protein
MEVTPRLVCPRWRWMTFAGSLVRELDGVGVAELVRRERPPHAGLGGDASQLGAGGVARPRPAAGGPVDHAQQRGDRHRHPELEPGTEVVPAHRSMPTSRRRPPLPWRTSIAPSRGSRSCSVTVSASSRGETAIAYLQLPPG